MVEHVLRCTRLLVQVLPSSKQKNLIKVFLKLSVCIQVDIQNVSHDKLMIILPLTEKNYKYVI